MKKRFNVHWAWIILGVGFVSFVVNYSVRLGYGVVLPEMVGSLKLSRTAAATIFNAYFVSYILIAPLTGVLADRIGARWIICSCSLILSFGVMLMGVSKTLVMSCIAFSITGLGATGMWAPVIALVQRWFAPRRRGFALGILSTGYGLGFAMIGAIFPWIVSQYNWRFAWYFLGIAALLIALMNGVLIRSDPESTGNSPWGERNHGVSERTAYTSKERSLSRIFKEKGFWIIGLSYFCISYSLYGITTFMVDYARSGAGYSLRQASLLATVHGLSQIVGVLVILPLSDILGRRKTIILSNSVICGCLVGILLVGDEWRILYILVGILAVFYGATFPVYGACSGDYFPRKFMASVVGAWSLFYGTGAILVHWVSGFLRDTTGDYQLPFLVDAAMAMISILFIFRLTRSQVDNRNYGEP